MKDSKEQRKSNKQQQQKQFCIKKKKYMTLKSEQKLQELGFRLLIFASQARYFDN